MNGIKITSYNMETIQLILIIQNTSHLPLRASYLSQSLRAIYDKYWMLYIVRIKLLLGGVM